MKSIITWVFIIMCVNAFGQEVETNCLAMNQAREKILKVAKVKSKTAGAGAIKQ